MCHQEVGTKGGMAMYGYAEFTDRTDAGSKLAALLEKYKDTDAVIVALPRGGVTVGKEIARRLHCPLDIAISRKIGHPGNPE
ncbi:MAG TPA: phosphoribosyltransferase family protein, partial [Armatimonadota bacterium]